MSQMSSHDLFRSIRGRKISSGQSYCSFHFHKGLFVRCSAQRMAIESSNDNSPPSATVGSLNLGSVAQTKLASMSRSIQVLSGF